MLVCLPRVGGGSPKVGGDHQFVGVLLLTRHSHQEQAEFGSGPSANKRHDTYRSFDGKYIHTVLALWYRAFTTVCHSVRGIWRSSHPTIQHCTSTKSRDDEPLKVIMTLLQPPRPLVLIAMPPKTKQKARGMPRQSRKCWKH